MPVYVSDILEDLLAATEIRTLVRRECSKLLGDLPVTVQNALAEPMHYISGKCMGYPAVWFVMRCIGADKIHMSDLLSKHPGALYLSLTTSIADDFLDGDVKNRHAQMMLFYTLIFGALKTPHWFTGPVQERYRQSVYPVMSWFLDEGKATNFVEDGGSELAAGKRIGAFFETIAECILSDIVTEKIVKIVLAAGKFGEWCSYLDDVIDLLDDISSNANETLPMRTLRSYTPEAAIALLNKDLNNCREIMSENNFGKSLAIQQLLLIDEISTIALESGLQVFAEEIKSLGERTAKLIEYYWHDLAHTHHRQMPS